MNKCPFCNFIDDERGKVVFENEYCFFIECIDDVLEGWGMILPKAHRETVFDLTPEEWQATYSMLERVKNYFDTTYKPDGYNVGWNVEKTGGQSVPHAHLHILSRYKDEPYAGKGIRHWIKQVDNKRHKLEK